MADEKEKVDLSGLENRVIVKNLQVKRVGDVTDSKFMGKICYITLLYMGGTYNLPASVPVAGKLSNGAMVSIIMELEPKAIEYVDFGKKQSRTVFIPSKLVDVAPSGT